MQRRPRHPRPRDVGIRTAFRCRKRRLLSEQTHCHRLRRDGLDRPHGRGRRCDQQPQSGGEGLRNGRNLLVQGLGGGRQAPPCDRPLHRQGDRTHGRLADGRTEGAAQTDRLLHHGLLVRGAERPGDDRPGGPDDRRHGHPRHGRHQARSDHRGIGRRDRLSRQRRRAGLLPAGQVHRDGRGRKVAARIHGHRLGRPG